MLLPLSLLAALPLASVWAAPMCSLKPKSSGASAIATAPASSSSGTSTSTSSTGGKNTTIPDDIVATTWYAGWHGSDPAYAFPPEKISWSKYTSVTYAFA